MPSGFTLNVPIDKELSKDVNASRTEVISTPFKVTPASAKLPEAQWCWAVTHEHNGRDASEALSRRRTS